MMMDSVRLLLAYVLLFSLPLVVVFWVVMHSAHHLWKNQTKVLAYTAAFAAMICAVIALYNVSEFLFSVIWPFSWAAFLLGLVIYVASYRLWRPVKQHLDFRTFSGQREVDGEAGTLITSGPFSVVRHPRYLMIVIGVVGWCLMIHYPAMYLVGIASILGLYVVITLEERELMSRFGQIYVDYKNRVPRLVPSLSGAQKIACARYT